MDKKSVVLVTFIIAVIFLSTAATYYKYVVLEDYDAYYDDYSEPEIESE